MTKQQILQQSIINTLVLKSLAPRADYRESCDQLLEALQDWLDELKGETLPAFEELLTP